MPENEGRHGEKRNHQEIVLWIICGGIAFILLLFVTFDERTLGVTRHYVAAFCAATVVSVLARFFFLERIKLRFQFAGISFQTAGTLAVFLIVSLLWITTASVEISSNESLVRGELNANDGDSDRPNSDGEPTQPNDSEGGNVQMEPTGTIPDPENQRQEVPKEEEDTPIQRKAVEEFQFDLISARIEPPNVLKVDFEISILGDVDGGILGRRGESLAYDERSRKYIPTKIAFGNTVIDRSNYLSPQNLIVGTSIPFSLFYEVDPEDLPSKLSKLEIAFQGYLMMGLARGRGHPEQLMPLTHHRGRSSSSSRLVFRNVSIE